MQNILDIDMDFSLKEAHSGLRDENARVPEG